MAQIASPYGFKPYNLIGSQFNNTSAVREYYMSSNVATAIFFGDIVQVASGNPQPLTSSPTIGTTHGVVGICVGVRYFDPTFHYFIEAQFLPANAITNGYTNVYVKVYEDPDGLFLCQCGAQINATATTAITTALGKNVGITYTGGSTTTGLSAVTINGGSSGANFATTNTLPIRVVDFYWNPLTAPPIPVGAGNMPNQAAADLYPDLIVKFNFGQHAYYDASGN